MKMSKRKLMSICSAAGISSALILSGCGEVEKERYKLKNGETVTKEEKDGKEGYYDKNGTFVPFIFTPANSTSLGATSSSRSSSSKSSSTNSSSRGSTGLGSSKGGASS